MMNTVYRSKTSQRYTFGKENELMKILFPEAATGGVL